MGGFKNSFARRGVYAYLTGSANTTCTNANTFYAIQGGFTNQPMEGFILGATAIQCTSNSTTWYEIDWHATLSSNRTGTTAYIGVSIDNETLNISNNTSIMSTYLKAATEPQTLSGTVVKQLSNNSTVQLQCASNGAGDVLTINNFSTTIRDFYTK